jgi:hypothetical protein
MRAAHHARLWATQVSCQYPASGGETLVAYATGLGQTNPAFTTGVPAAQSSPAVSKFNLDSTIYSAGRRTDQSPAFAGPTQGFIGLFVVSPPPADLGPCSMPAIADGPSGGLVLSNLTVSIGSFISFAGVDRTPKYIFRVKGRRRAEPDQGVARPAIPAAYRLEQRPSKPPASARQSHGWYRRPSPAANTIASSATTLSIRIQ